MPIILNCVHTCSDVYTLIVYFVLKGEYFYKSIDLISTHSSVRTLLDISFPQYIGEGEYDFYMFQPEEDDVLPDPRIIDDLTLRFFMDSYQSEAPPVPPRSVGTQSAAPPAEEEPLPVYRVIPFVRKTEIPLNIQRKALEEYMDR